MRWRALAEPRCGALKQRDDTLLIFLRTLRANVVPLIQKEHFRSRKITHDVVRARAKKQVRRQGGHPGGARGGPEANFARKR